MRRLIITLLLISAAMSAQAAGDYEKPIQKDWAFDGFLGKFDYESVQRGFTVYKNGCASCHSLKRIAYRNLQEVGFTEGQAKAIAAEYEVTDGPNDDGELFQRPARLSDRFVSPFPNEQAARAANGGAYPPDLSLMVKARPDGANYLYSLLLGYEEPPADVKLGTGMYYNIYYPGKQIAMPQQLSAGLVDYADGTEASIEQMATDITNFLQWTAEPEMQQRKKMGVRTFIYLVIMTILLYAAKRRIWSDVK